MNELKKNIVVKIGSEKNFGYTFTFIFFILSIYFFLKLPEYFLFTFIISLTFFFITFFFSSILKYPNIIWHKFGLLLGLFVSPIIIFITYILTIVPIGIIFKIIKKDPMNRKRNDKIESYWVERDEKVNDMKNQY